jgi:alpha-beta hydrolase superfamily lysophospholipase
MTAIPTRRCSDAMASSWPLTLQVIHRRHRLLLFHGGGQTQHAWRTTVDDLSRRGFFAAVEAKGRLAGSALVRIIKAARVGASPRVRHRLLPTELVLRGSTAPEPARRRER